MKKMFLAVSIFLAVFITAPLEALALEPVLYFSDITSGPKTGLGDGKGSGAIVTVWGVNLGSSQGTSKVYVGGVPAAYVYYWGNADTTGASGPADLYAYHKMQTISFSVPAGVPDGATTISVTVGGAQTNTLPFTVRSGKIHFVKTTGVNSTSSTGSWDSPFKTLSYVVLGSGNLGGGGKVAPGDIIYATDGVTEPSGLPVKYIKATAAMPLAIVAYPGASVVVLGPSFGIGNHNHDSAYWSFSKLTVKTNGNGIDTFKGMRAVANEITNYPGGCANGQGGSISGSNFNDPTSDVVGGGIKIYGNYVHDYGCSTTSKLHHVFYISNRGGYAVEAFELGWNHLRDNKAHHALHVYDEGICGDFSGTLRIHDNVVKNQVGVGVGISSTITGTCFTMPVEIYNNLFMNIGLENPGDNSHNYGIGIGDKGTKSTVKIYNNTFYGYGQTGSPTSYLLDIVTFGGTYEFVNNIIVDTTNSPYLANGVKAPTLSSGNLWYNGGDGTPAAPPSWDPAALTSDPLFVDPAKGFFNLQSGSPALGAGTSTSPVVKRDFRGLPRGLGKNYSIGAFEHIKSSLPAAPALLPVK